MSASDKTPAGLPRRRGRVRWLRIVAIVLPSLALSGGLLGLTAGGALASAPPHGQWSQDARGVPGATPSTDPSSSASPSPDPSASPSPSPSASPSPTPSPSPSPTPSPSASPSPSPSATASGSASPSPSPSSSTPAPVATPPTGLVVASQASSITATSATLDGLSFDGVASVHTSSGTEQVLEFSMTSLTLDDASLSITQSGEPLTIAATEFDFSGSVTLLATQLSGTFDGARVSFTTADPPPTTLTGDLTLTDVSASQPFASAGSFSVTGLQVSD
jgi:hypothetical protein